MSIEVATSMSSVGGSCPLRRASSRARRTRVIVSTVSINDLTADMAYGVAIALALAYAAVAIVLSVLIYARRDITS